MLHEATVILIRADFAVLRLENKNIVSPFGQQSFILFERHALLCFEGTSSQLRILSHCISAGLGKKRVHGTSKKMFGEKKREV